MGTLLESKEAIRAEAEADALIANRVDSLARLAFVACPPGEAPTDAQIGALFGDRVVPTKGHTPRSSD